MGNKQICPKCGKEVQSDWEFCVNCGHVMKETNAKTSELPWLVDGFVNSEPPGMSKLENVQNLDKKRKTKVVIASVILILVFVVIAFSMVPKPVTGFEGIDDDTIVLKVGEDYKLDVTPIQDGFIKSKVEYKSSDETVFTINKRNRLIGQHQGEAELTITASDYSETFKVVVDPNVKEITCEEEVGIIEGDSYQLTVVLTPSSADPSIIKFESNDTSIAQVDNNGIITGIAVGSTAIVVTAGDQTKTIAVTIIPAVNPYHPDVEALDYVELEVGDSTELNNYIYSNPYVDFTFVLMDEYDEDYDEASGIATVTKKGTVKAKKPGYIEVLAYPTDDRVNIGNEDNELWFFIEIY